jgi:RTX calcium-binding nonapeptide repeat (4 copies)
MRLGRGLPSATIAVWLVLIGPAAAQTSHEGWPRITGMLLMNKTDRGRPLDARPGYDPFGRQDASYSCDAVHKRGRCHSLMVACNAAGAQAGTCAPGGRMVSGRHVHNELLGGHGSDSIHAGPTGDVLWGDYKPGGQPEAQHDVMVGGAGNDHIYASHGYNAIDAGAGDDYVKAHFGRGVIDCGPGRDVLFVSRRAQRRYAIHGCERVSHATVGRQVLVQPRDRRSDRPRPPRRRSGPVRG